MQPLWTAAAPVVAGNRVVLAAADGASIHCLNLRDGGLLWKSPRLENDLYLAGVNRGKVLVVGKRACRALDLATGRQLWETLTGQPSGLGVCHDGAYYLPLRHTIRDSRAVVAVLDLDSGRCAAQLPTLPDDPPGNLIFLNDIVLSQTTAAITAYPRRSEPR
jgi:outer membrane protein assembly factor BamB